MNPLYFTVTLQLAVFLPSFVVTVIVAFPFLTPLTTPLLVTVAIFLLLVFQVTALFVAFDGLIVAFNVAFFPIAKFNFVLLNFTLLIGIGLTVTLHTADLFPSIEVTVIVAFPILIPLTTPVAEMVATDLSLDFQVTFLLVALAGVNSYRELNP